MNNLELPGYSMFVRPQCYGATTTDIIYESGTALPKLIKIHEPIDKYQQFNGLKVTRARTHIFKYIYLCMYLH